MLNFDITQAPPSRQELATEHKRLTQQKKLQIKSSCISDAAHGSILLGLYLTDLLSGYGLLVAIGMGTMIAVMLAQQGLKSQQSSGNPQIAIFALLGMASVIGILRLVMTEPVAGSLIAGLLAGSMIVAGSIIGRKIMQVYSGLERLKSLAEDETAEAEMRALCRKSPQAEDYRQQALQILRPNLTFGELEAMRKFTHQG